MTPFSRITSGDCKSSPRSRNFRQACLVRKDVTTVVILLLLIVAAALATYWPTSD
jgi:hypothetical protein